MVKFYLILLEKIDFQYNCDIIKLTENWSVKKVYQGYLLTGNSLNRNFEIQNWNV